MKSGFYSAVGTPLDEKGHVIAESLKRHVEDQVEAKAAGLLVMGTMGIQAAIKNSEYVKVAQMAVDVAKQRCPVIVGVMDNSIGRVLDRIESLAGLQIDGVVATMPFYHKLDQSEASQFFQRVAAESPFPVYMYDLPSVTQSRIEPGTAAHLMTVDNIAGIKTGDLTTARILQRMQQEKNQDFNIFFSGLDLFDVAYGYGLTKQLDGMFACTTKTTVQLYKSLETGDWAVVGRCLDDILLLRNTFVEVGVFRGFSYAMNLLGFAGRFSPDYVAAELDERGQELVKACMRQLKLIGDQVSI